MGWMHARGHVLGRGEQIMLQFLPIMLCCTAPKNYLLCLYHVPIMLNLNGFIFDSDQHNHSLIVSNYSDVLHNCTVLTKSTPELYN